MENKNELIITRNFNAPRELVFKAWTEADQLAKWWGPKEAEIVVSELSIYPGGKFHYSMEFPGQPKMWGIFVYKEIVALERIVFSSSFSDEKGNITRNPWTPVWPLEVMNTVELTEHNGITTLTIKGGPINATEEECRAFIEAAQSMQQGFKGTFDKLDEYLTAINK